MIKINGDRITAILIINNKAYISDCDHQDCLEMYYKDNNIKSEFDYSSEDFDKVQAKAIEKTFEMKNTHEVYGYDVFDADELDYVLLAHDEETYNNTSEWAKRYAKENNCKLGYFLEGYDAIILEE